MVLQLVEKLWNPGPPKVYSDFSIWFGEKENCIMNDESYSWENATFFLLWCLPLWLMSHTLEKMIFSTLVPSIYEWWVILLRKWLFSTLMPSIITDESHSWENATFFFYSDAFHYEWWVILLRKWFFFYSDAFHYEWWVILLRKWFFLLWCLPLWMLSHTLEKMIFSYSDAFHYECWVILLRKCYIFFYSDAFLTELTWQMLIRGYLTSLLFVHQLTFGLRCISVNQ